MNFRMISFLRRLKKNTIPEWLLVSLWIAGSSLGFFAARFIEDASVSFLQSAPSRIPDWRGVLISAVLPLLLSALAVMIFHNVGCYGCCLTRSLSQGMMIGLISRSYSNGAPLMVFLLLFSGLLVNPVMLRFWFRRLTTHDDQLFSDAGICLGACLTIGAVDYLLIAPFLVDVINLS